MAKVYVGEGMVLPWYNMFELYTTKPENFTGHGGYIVIDGRTHFMLNGNISQNITFPTPQETFDLYYQTENGVEVQENFNGVFTGRGNIYMEGSYLNE